MRYKIHKLRHSYIIIDRKNEYKLDYVRHPKNMYGNRKIMFFKTREEAQNRIDHLVNETVMSAEKTLTIGWE